MQQLEELITGAEVARRLGVSRQRVGQLREQAGFPTPVGKVGQAVVWRPSDIEAWARGARNLITIEGFPVGWEQAAELAARLTQKPSRDPAAARVGKRIDAALKLKTGTPIRVEGDELVAVYQALQKWLDDVGPDVLGPQLKSLRYGLDVRIHNQEVRENLAAAFTPPWRDVSAPPS